MKYKLAVLLTMVVTIFVALSSTAEAGAGPPLTRKVLRNTIGQSVQVGTPHVLKIYFKNMLFKDKKYMKYAKKKKIKPNIKMTAYVVWGSFSWPVLESQGGSMLVDDDKTTPRPSFKVLKAHQSRKMTFLVNFKACLPPWAPDPQTPATLDPNSIAYFGLPCASGRWYLRTRAYIRGLGWSSWSANLGGDVYITP